MLVLVVPAVVNCVILVLEHDSHMLNAESITWESTFQKWYQKWYATWLRQRTSAILLRIPIVVNRKGQHWCTVVRSIDTAWGASQAMNE